MYHLILSFHILFAIAWIAALFYLPRILVNLVEAGDESSLVRYRLHLMGQRLYRFGCYMFGLALLFGLTLWEGWRIWPRDLPNVSSSTHWIDAKIGLVAALLVYFFWMGRLLKRNTMGVAVPSGTSLRWLNELPVLLVLGALYLALAKPF